GKVLGARPAVEAEEPAGATGPAVARIRQVALGLSHPGLELVDPVEPVAAAVLGLDHPLTDDQVPLLPGPEEAPQALGQPALQGAAPGPGTVPTRHRSQPPPGLRSGWPRHGSGG